VFHAVLLAKALPFRAGLITAIIPEEETGPRHRLKAVTSDRWNAPEALWHKGGLAFYDRFGEEPPTEGWGKHAVDIWMGRDTDDETDGLGCAVVVEPSSALGRTDWWLVATFVVLVLLGVVVYLREHR